MVKFVWRGVGAVILGAALGCAPVDGPGTSVFYECQPPKSLRVDYRGSEAWVSVDGSRAIRLKQEPSASGLSYQSGGYRLRTKGSEAIWTGLTREAPYQCRQVLLPG
ncbi:MliC family protein [Sphingomonas jaspsi]|uniref:MliC family protein n=1 Tax=Sphingomonas jaspsi TaxID=392409 RepID=UPI0009FCB57C